MFGNLQRWICEGLTPTAASCTAERQGSFSQIGSLASLRDFLFLCGKPLGGRTSRWDSGLGPGDICLLFGVVRERLGDILSESLPPKEARPLSPFCATERKAGRSYSDSA